MLRALFVCTVSVAAAVEIDSLGDALYADDECTGVEDGSSFCALNAAQLRATKRAQEAKALEDFSEEQQTTQGAEEEQPGFFVETDTNGDGEVQQEEAAALMGRLGAKSDEQAVAMFKDQDGDSSKGLNMMEFGKAMEEWGTHCSVVHTNWFCSGSTRVRCCTNVWGVWHECGHIAHHHGCFGGHGTRWGGGGGLWLEQQPEEQEAQEAQPAADGELQQVSAARGGGGGSSRRGMGSTRRRR